MQNIASLRAPLCRLGVHVRNRAGTLANQKPLFVVPGSISAAAAPPQSFASPSRPGLPERFVNFRFRIGFFRQCGVASARLPFLYRLHAIPSQKTGECPVFFFFARFAAVTFRRCKASSVRIPFYRLGRHDRASANTRSAPASRFYALSVPKLNSHN